MMAEKPRTPEGLRAPGKRLWASIVDVFDLDEHELAMLVEACRTVDVLDLLDARVRSEGPTVTGPQGVKANPALVEARQQRIALARLLAVLRLPAGEEDVDEKSGARRPQRRVGARGAYGIRGAVS
jgi:hypothetical protein